VAAKADRFRRLRRVAQRRDQRGYFTTEQACAAGVTPDELTLLVTRGVIEREARGLYRFVVSTVPTWKDQLAGELLRTGGNASGLSAAALYGLAAPPARPSVIVARGSRHAVPGHHTTRELHEEECERVDGLQTLGPTRMVLDVVHRMSRARGRALIESAIVRGLVDPDALRKRALELSNRKRPGCAITIQLLDDLHPELTRSRNEWEALVVRRATALGLPRPELEHDVVIGGRRYILDAAWSRWLVTLEFDGRDPHMRKAVHDNDSVRRNDLTAAGWLRFSITAGALQQRDDRVFHQVAAAIAQRSRA
jgi:very-short-patch-repair endonuclease